DNAVWLAHQRKRGVEVTVEGRTPHELKVTPNHHYNGTFLEPWGQRSQRGYGVEVLRRFFEEEAQVEFGGPPEGRDGRLRQVRGRRGGGGGGRPAGGAAGTGWAGVRGGGAPRARHAAGQPGGVVTVNDRGGGLLLRLPGRGGGGVLYGPRV